MKRRADLDVDVGTDSEEEEEWKNIMMEVNAAQLTDVNAEYNMQKYLAQKKTSGTKEDMICSIPASFYSDFGNLEAATSVSKMNKDLARIKFDHNYENMLYQFSEKTKHVVLAQRFSTDASYARIGVRALDRRKDIWELAILVQPYKEAVLVEYISMMPSGWIHKATTDPLKYSRPPQNAVSLLRFTIQSMVGEFPNLKYGRIFTATKGSQTMLQRAGYNLMRDAPGSPVHDDRSFDFPRYWSIDNPKRPRYKSTEQEQDDDDDDDGDGDSSISFSSNSSDKISGPMWFHLCHQCGAPPTAVCSQCKAARYCSADCQRKGWRKGHRKECGK